ncbi:MAG: Uncharacterised protein [Chloroflexota bacterium]|nr:MAG: Uncharacterised protein [Chloroflexota bacterium]
MSAIKSYLHDLLTDDMYLSNINTIESHHLMKHSTDQVYHLEETATLSLDPYRITIREKDSDNSLTVRLSPFADGRQAIHNAIESYLSDLDYSHNSLFISDLAASLQTEIAANEMKPPTDNCKLKAVD